MPNALITGVTGQDGAYLSKLLVDKGYRVFGAVRSSSSPNLRFLEFLGVRDAVERVAVDLMDFSSVLRLLERTEPDEVYNLAAQSSVGLSFEQPLATISFNSTSTANLLEALRIAGTGAKFYQASSSEMFGDIGESAADERTPFHPTSPYGISKCSAHWTAVHYRETYGLHACCGILFNHESALRPGHFVTKKVLSTAVSIAAGQADLLMLGDVDVRRDWVRIPVDAGHPFHGIPDTVTLHPGHRNARCRTPLRCEAGHFRPVERNPAGRA